MTTDEAMEWAEEWKRKFYEALTKIKTLEAETAKLQGLLESKDQIIWALSAQIKELRECLLK